MANWPGVSHLVLDDQNSSSSDINGTSSGSHCEDASGESGSFVIGVLMGFIGSVLINIGQNLQATGLKALPVEQKAKPCSSRMWIIGQCTFIVGALLNFLAFTFASASILVPIEAIQFVVNLIWAKFVNKEEISRSMMSGVGLTVLGTILCVVFGSSDTRCFTIDDLIGFWASALWWVYLVLSVSVGVGALVVHANYERRVEAGESPPHHVHVLPIAYALSSALLGGAQMIVHSKAIAELFELQVQLIEPAPVTTWYFYLEFTLLATLGIFWLYRMNAALGIYDPLFIIPLLQSNYILFGVIAGGIYFEEFAGLHNGPHGWWSWPFFIAGISCVLYGLYLIAPPAEPEPARARDASINGRRQRVHSIDQQTVDAIDPHLEPEHDTVGIVLQDVTPYPPMSSSNATPVDLSGSKGKHSRTPSWSRTPSTLTPAEITITLNEPGEAEMPAIDDGPGFRSRSSSAGPDGPKSRTSSVDRATPPLSKSRGSSIDRAGGKALAKNAREAEPLSPRMRELESEQV